ncbi:MAG: hypothetical protein HZB75_00555 [Candidatus Saccharibacteria bacterium]|nr:MAG: hypothetical protein HZB75_00555 [Candidatus Saccharibacteria bacterium]
MPGEILERVNFWEVFRRGQNDSLITIVPIIVSTARFEADTIVNKGSTLGGIDFHTYIDRDIAITKTDSGTYIIKGFYLPE